MNFYNENIEKFLNDLSSDMPAPGGGAVAGLVSALSGSLNSMVYSLTVGKKKYNELTQEKKVLISEFRGKSELFIKRSLELMDEDRDNFMLLMESYKLPQNNEEDKLFRKNKIRENTIKAMEAPLALGRESLEFYENLKVMKKYGNKMLLSDLSIAAILLHSSIESSVINIKVNLNSLRQEEFFEEIDKEISSMIEESLRNKNELCSYIDNIIYCNKKPV